LGKETRVSGPGKGGSLNKRDIAPEKKKVQRGCTRGGRHNERDLDLAQTRAPPTKGQKLGPGKGKVVLPEKRCPELEGEKGGFQKKKKRENPAVKNERQKKVVSTTNPPGGFCWGGRTCEGNRTCVGEVYPHTGRGGEPGASCGKNLREKKNSSSWEEKRPGGLPWGRERSNPSRGGTLQHLTKGLGGKEKILLGKKVMLPEPAGKGINVLSGSLMTFGEEPQKKKGEGRKKDRRQQKTLERSFLSRGEVIRQRAKGGTQKKRGGKTGRAPIEEKKNLCQEISPLERQLHCGKKGKKSSWRRHTRPSLREKKETSLQQDSSRAEGKNPKERGKKREGFLFLPTEGTSSFQGGGLFCGKD